MWLSIVDIWAQLKENIWNADFQGKQPLNIENNIPIAAYNSPPRLALCQTMERLLRRQIREPNEVVKMPQPVAHC